MGLAEPAWACLVQYTAATAWARRQISAEQGVPGSGTAASRVAPWGLKQAVMAVLATLKQLCGETEPELIMTNNGV